MHSEPITTYSEVAPFVAPLHSHRKAVIGSIDIARWAGKALAAPATAISGRVTAARMSGLVDVPADQ